MKYREITEADLRAAISDSLATDEVENFEYLGIEYTDPGDLLNGLGLNAPSEQKQPLRYLKAQDKKDGEEYDWAGLKSAVVPPVIVVDGVMMDGFHRCRLSCVLGVKVYAVFYKRKSQV